MKYLLAMIVSFILVWASIVIEVKLLYKGKSPMVGQMTLTEMTLFVVAALSCVTWAYCLVALMGKFLIWIF